MSPKWPLCLLGNKGVALTRTLTEQRQKKGGELETRWQKASNGRVTDSAIGPR